MKRFFLFAALLSFGLSNPVFSDTRTNIAYILDQHVISLKTDEQFAALWDKTFENLRPAIEKLGGQITHPERFMEELLGDFQVSLMNDAYEAASAAYEVLLTPEELANIAAFYRTDEGQKMLSKGLTEETLNTYVDFFKGDAGAAMLRHLPELLAATNDPISKATSRLSEKFAINRFADIFEMKDVVHFEDEARRRDVVAGIRALN